MISVWISVKDRLPELNKEVLVRRPKEIIISELVEYEGKTYWSICGTSSYADFYLCNDITHWQPLPGHPKG